MPEIPVQNARTRHPNDPEWRADALGQSRHSRLTEALVQPRPVSEAGALRLCAQICRKILGDFAPAVILLPPGERQRCQTFAAWTAIIFDFAWQRGVEGERLAALGQWHYRLEEVLEGVAAPVQPIYIRMLAEHRRRRWDLNALDALRRTAERHITRPPSDLQQAVNWTEQVASGLSGSLLESPPGEVRDLTAGLLRLRALQEVSEGLRQHRPTPAVLRLRERREAGPALHVDSVESQRRAIAAECEEIHPLLLAVGRSVPDLPVTLQRSALYLVYAGIALLTRVEAHGQKILERVPHLGAWRRVRLLMRARRETR